MDKKISYRGIDYVRLAAALLIIAIHTSPLLSYSETGDFIFTRIIARVGVPFFFMTSGFFLISEYTDGNKKLAEFVKKTALIYIISVLIYLPLNIYNGYFKMGSLFLNIIKDIVFDGTFYHLWYLPAAIEGAAIAWLLVKKMGFKGALSVAFLLYIIGLFGDSYYGIIEKNSFLKEFYRQLFLISDYTRNGIFFAPLFFVLGGYIRHKVESKNGRRIGGAKKFIVGFSVSFILMFAEAMLLHYFDIQRHDSMYIFLPLCMYFMFRVVLCQSGKGPVKKLAKRLTKRPQKRLVKRPMERPVLLRDVSMMVYIIHPMVIVIVRLFARLTGLWELLVENSLGHYIAVCFLSVAGAFFLIFLYRLYNYFKCNAENSKGDAVILKIKDIMLCQREKPDFNTSRAWIEINLDNLGHNLRAIKNAMPPESEIMAVVKARAYGHGLFEVSSYLNKKGVKSFAVATIDEGISLRKYGIHGEILILGYTDPHFAGKLRKYNLTQSIIDLNYARELNRRKVTVKCHIKIDTGMHRLGILYQNAAEVMEIFSMKYIKICGIYTHLCCSDSRNPYDVEFTRRQISRFYALIDFLKERGFPIPKLHIQSSYGLLNYPELKCDYVRAGIALYGVLSSMDDNTKLKLMLRPVLSLKARVVLIRNIKMGESAGYGREFRAARDTVLAVISVGYGDGFPRNLSCGKSFVMINGSYAPVVGKICMDQLLADVTEIEGVSRGDVATLVGGSEMGVCVPFAAENSGSISNELLSRMGARLPVVVKNGMGK